MFTDRKSKIKYLKKKNTFLASNQYVIKNDDGTLYGSQNPIVLLYLAPVRLK